MHGIGARGAIDMERDTKQGSVGSRSAGLLRAAFASGEGLFRFFEPFVAASISLGACPGRHIVPHHLPLPVNGDPAVTPVAAPGLAVASFMVAVLHGPLRLWATSRKLGGPRTLGLSLTVRSRRTRFRAVALKEKWHDGASDDAIRVVLSN